MNYGIAFTPLVPSFVLWAAMAAIVVIAVMLLLARSRCAARRGTGADRARAVQSLLHPRGPRAAEFGGRRRRRQEPEPEFRHAHAGDGEGAGGARRQPEEDQGPRGPRGRRRPGRRRDRRYASVRRAA